MGGNKLGAQWLFWDKDQKTDTRTQDKSRRLHLMQIEIDKGYRVFFLLH